MAVLPASVRVALWATAALAGRLRPEEVAGRALPDLDHCDGLAPRLDLWGGLGERIVLVALPRPGDLTSMPKGPAELLAAATEAEELVYVPGLGGALVPTIEQYGPEGDQGWQARWTAFDADPVPLHVVEQLALPDVELQLRRDIAALTEELVATSGRPLRSHGLDDAVRDGLDADWGLPEGLPPRALRVVGLAGAITTLAETGLDHRLQSADSSSTLDRERILRALHDRASHALVSATNAAAMHLAGWR